MIYNYQACIHIPEANLSQLEHLEQFISSVLGTIKEKLGKVASDKCCIALGEEGKNMTTWGINIIREILNRSAPSALNVAKYASWEITFMNLLEPMVQVKSTLVSPASSSKGKGKLNFAAAASTLTTGKEAMKILLLQLNRKYHDPDFTEWASFVNKCGVCKMGAWMLTSEEAAEVLVVVFIDFFQNMVVSCMLNKHPNRICIEKDTFAF